MRVFGHAMPTGKLGAEGGVIPISAINSHLRRSKVLEKQTDIFGGS